jgi:NADPH:quinone reductase-like Zn-dependent oxidoreductase
VVRVVEVATPSPGAGELLIRVRATTVNRTDCGYRAARPFFIRAWSGLRRPKMPILGTEFAGSVEAVGREVTSFAVGDRVFGYCEGTFGAHAEAMTIPADAAVARIPAGMTYEEVAPATEGWHYAWANIRAAGVRCGQDVLVHGATGAIGSAAVQILAAEGAHVTAVCAGEHREIVVGLGADRVIDRTTADFTDTDDTYDVVFDAVGKTTLGRCRRLLRPGGVFLTTDLGPGAQNPVLAVVTRLVGRTRVVIGLPGDHRTVAHEVQAMMEAGRFRPLIDRTYPLHRIVDAYRYVETGQKVGNVVVAVPGGDEPHGDAASGDGTARPEESPA